MALMKKLQPGGTVDSNTLADQINSEISKFNFKSKDERRVREALSSILDYRSNPEGKTFSVDRVTQKYTVTGEGAEKFTGSSDEVRSN